MTRRADHDRQRQARVLAHLLAASGRTQTQAAAAGDISYPHFRRFLDGRTPLRDDLYASVARAVGVTERELRLALAGEQETEQAPDGWDFRAELEAALPGDPNGFARAWQRLADEPYEYQRVAIEAYRVLRETSDEAPREFSYRPGDDPDDDMQRNMQRTAK